MKNKNLIFGMFLLGIVLMSSFAFAGITGYVIRGQTLSADGVTATLQGVDRFGTATIAVKDETGNVETVRVVEGETATTSLGTEVAIKNVRTGGLFRKAGGEISVSSAEEASSGAGTTGTITPTTEEECFDNCQAFTERYRLDEGETISIGGDTIIISFIDADSVSFEVNGQQTDLFSENQWFELSNSQILEVEDIHRLEVGGQIGWVVLGLKGYKLDEGETINLQGNSISIDFIDADEVRLDVNNQLTNLLIKDNTFELNNNQLAVVGKIAKLEVGGTTGYVRIDLASCYFPYFYLN